MTATEAERVLLKPIRDVREVNDYFVRLKGVSWALILLEEVAEVLEEAYAGEEAIAAELTQVAAVCVAWLEDIESRKRKP
ncbi:MAG: hypothetical protein QM729_21400 [Solirubrobacterales bacterium]